ncbi:hypothetical protein Pfo_028745 [Paulownia fortunei]|nr:hypothetical protein Pfo_028745 [Paulownia fortunei]
MICYPLFTDQITNRKLVVDDWRVGMNLCDGASITREEVAEKIGILMSGERSDELRQEIKKVRETLQNALTEDGSSEKNFDCFVQDVSDEILRRCNQGDLIDFIPGVQSIKSKDLMSYLQDVDITTITHQIVIKAFEQVKYADFILINTVNELEHQTVLALNQKQPAYAVGPINFSTDFTKTVVPKSLWSETDCTEWLNSKPPGSVLYVSFGSLAQCNKQLAEEIAYGLLLSEVNFVWVLREDTDVLPDEFKNDMKDPGLIVSWCNQNPTNRKLVVDDWKIGINLCDGTSVDRKEVAEKIKQLMSGETSNGLRHEIKKIRAIVHKALAEDGSTQRNFGQFLKELRAKVNSTSQDISTS